jgi:hypothetical protein
MKVNIGPYKNYLSTHGIKCDYLELRYGEEEWYLVSESAYTRLDNIVIKFLKTIDSCLQPINKLFNTRKIKVHIDRYDVFSMDHTLSLIIVPMLKQLRRQKQGSPIVDAEDVPDYLRPRNEPNEDNDYVDDTHHARWDWVLDEMIWAFEQHADDNETDQFHHNLDNMRVKFEKTESNLSTLKVESVDESKPAHYYDIEGYKKHENRKAEGRRLFAKYYNGLWD